jgi:hypothetical protein
LYYHLGGDFFTTGKKMTPPVGVIIYLRERRFLEKIGRLLHENTQIADFQMNNLQIIAIKTAGISILAVKDGFAVRAIAISTARIAISTQQNGNFAT